MSQVRTMVHSICVIWSMTYIVTIIGAPLVVARHREFSFVDYQDENGHSIVSLSNMWPLKSLTCNTTWFLVSLIITTYDFNSKSLTLWDRRKSQQLYEIRRLPGFRWIYVEVGVIQIESFSKQMECDMIYRLSLTRSFFPTNFHSNLNTIQKILTYLYLLLYIPWNCWNCSYWKVA